MTRPRTSRWLAALAAAALASGCRQDMHDQPRYEAFEGADIFADGRSARPQIPGTIARGQLRLDEHFFDGRSGGALVTTFPFPVTGEVLERGRDRYNVFCSPCHDRTGSGMGMIVRRGFRRPTSFHVDRLREEPVGHFYDVITNGFGAMTDYSDRIAPRDRWAIVAYVRALQLSRNAGTDDVPADILGQLRGRQR